jgi:hypothetical protein
VVAWAAQDIGATVQPLTSVEWTGLLESAGSNEIIEKTYAINTKDETKGILGRYGWGGMLRVMGRTLMLYAKSPAYRMFVKEVRQGGIIPDHLEEYFGYGLFVGRK